MSGLTGRVPPKGSQTSIKALRDMHIVVREWKMDKKHTNDEAWMKARRIMRDYVTNQELHWEQLLTKFCGYIGLDIPPSRKSKKRNTFYKKMLKLSIWDIISMMHSRGHDMEKITNVASERGGGFKSVIFFLADWSINMPKIRDIIKKEFPETISESMMKEITQMNKNSLLPRSFLASKDVDDASFFNDPKLLEYCMNMFKPSLVPKEEPQEYSQDSVSDTGSATPIVDSPAAHSNIPDPGPDGDIDMEGATEEEKKEVKHYMNNKQAREPNRLFVQTRPDTEESSAKRRLIEKTDEPPRLGFKG